MRSGEGGLLAGHGRANAAVPVRWEQTNHRPEGDRDASD